MEDTSLRMTYPGIPFTDVPLYKEQMWDTLVAPGCTVGACYTTINTGSAQQIALAEELTKKLRLSLLASTNDLATHAATALMRQ